MSIIYQVPAILHKHDIRRVVLSPGSRNAPLTISFARHTSFEKYIIPDERSAAFVALGMAQTTEMPVVLVCTSGSAALNYAPAVAEAYFANTPLLILTADRPPEWIDQQDGQTIRQQNLFGNHVRAFFQLPVETAHPDASWEFCRKLNEAVHACKLHQGPVHVNIPFREPFYPEQEFTFDEALQYIAFPKIGNRSPEPFLTEFLTRIPSQVKILCIAGQAVPNEELNDIIPQLGIPVVTEPLSNIAPSANRIQKQDLFLSKLSEVQQAELRPDLLITWGGAVVSKSLKQFIRTHKPLQHWHLSASNQWADTFKSLSGVIDVNPVDFLQALINTSYNKRYLNEWTALEKKAVAYTENQLAQSQELTELNAFRTVIQYLPPDAYIHVANSMPVRYLNLLGFSNPDPERVFCNRGTSGIDGAVSTAVGCALSTDKTVVLLTGDMSFFYDRNAWWHNYNCPNLKVIVFNNHGGGIFRIIDGPKGQPELEEYFVTRQNLTARHLANEFDLNYFHANNYDALKSQLHKLMNASTQPSVLEIETDGQVDVSAFHTFKQQFKLS
ncbi:MAG TPA: 2-succinyl-5-enolpyruvyl-6-hydroxy-3-cyclohexene-1-carboxylic-acid synthase [Cytophagaceae bacterium]|jgi:2-succinyl-5-enolpyruvyl-6-hydroxy-3-cyclohexene-1-carboxylate synthase|nr:2-succinyl-5-enolpyruvyl-6-hydroxy-3-cyclohexene-1-carboxylic-acid synthase [Cytophagaceae bacterium]